MCAEKVEYHKGAWPRFKVYFVKVFTPTCTCGFHYLGSFLISRRFLTSLRTIVHFKRLGSRVSYDSFNQYVLFFSKQCTYCKTNAIYT